ncbi:MAG: LPS assembly lipoprotein LptE [Holophagaceae bacterium]|jgi:hypothetical protein
MKILVLLTSLWTLGCGYQRLNRMPERNDLIPPGDTVEVALFTNSSSRQGIESLLTEALRYQITKSTPWKLSETPNESQWILRGNIDRWETRSLSINLGQGLTSSSAGSPTRVDVVIVASLDLVDRKSGAIVFSRRGLTFSNQYRVDQNFLNFINTEDQTFRALSKDFSQSFLIQFLEAR